MLDLVALSTEEHANMCTLSLKGNKDVIHQCVTAKHFHFLALQREHAGHIVLYMTKGKRHTPLVQAHEIHTLAMTRVFTLASFDNTAGQIT